MKKSFFAVLKKVLPKRTLYWQVAFTLLAFATVVFFGYLIMSTAIRNHLSRNSVLTLDLAMTKIDAELRGPETTLRAFAESVQQRLVQGVDANNIQEFMLNFNRHLSFHAKDGTTPATLFGFFYTLGDEPVFLHSGGWIPPEGYNHQHRPWHRAAIAGGGSPAHSELYLDLALEQYGFAIAQSIHDESGRLLGVVSLQVPIGIVGDIVIKTAAEQGGYGMILGQDLKVHAHPNRSFEGMQVPDPELPFSIFYENFVRGEDIFEHPITSFGGEESLAFFRKTQDGWYYGTVVPSAPYYKSITNAWYALVAVGVIAALFLILILARTDAKKNRATALTNALNKMSEIFLTQSGKAFEDVMNAGGKLLADLAEVDRFSLLRNTVEDGSLYMSQIYRWEKASGGTTKPNNNFVHVAYRQIAPEWEHMFKEEKSFSGPVRLMPKRESVLLKGLGTRSAFVAPVHINGALWGFVLFEDQKKERVFDKNLAETMQSAAFLFANAVISAEFEARLASERDFTQELIDTAPVGMNVWDDDYNIIDCNDAVETIFGCTKQYYIDHFGEFSPEYQPDGIKTVDKVKELQSRVRKGEIIVSEWMHCSAAGEPIPCEITMTRLTYNNKNTVLVYLYDLRNLKKMEKAVLEAGQAMALIDAVPLSCILIDKNINILTCNKTAVEFFKLSKKEDIQSLFIELMPEYQPDGRNSREVATGVIKKAFDEGYSFFKDWIHRSMDGELLPCEVALVRVEYGGDYVVAAYARDLRVVKEAEAKMREADERAQLMLEQAPLITLLWDDSFHLLACNQETVRILGLSSKEEVMDKFFDLFPEYQPNGMTTQELLLGAQTLIFKEKAEFAQIELTMNHSVSGEAIPFDITLVRIKYKDGYAVLTYGVDLRERNAAIAKIREADERAQILFGTAPLAGCMFDDSSNVIECNQEMVNLFGIPNKDFFLKNFFSVLFPEYQPNGELSADVSVNNGRLAFEKGYYRFECMHQKLNGEPLPCEVTMVRVKYRGEDAIAGYFRDLTEQKAAEQLTKEVMEKTSTLTAILDTTPDLIFCKDLDSLYTLCNKSFEKLINIPIEDIIGKDDVEGLKVPPEIAKAFLLEDEKIFSENQVIMFENYLLSHDGTRIPFETMKAPLVMNGKVTGLVGIARNITLRKKMEEDTKKAYNEAMKAYAAAENALEAKNLFVANMNHEMRTPMNVIVGLTDLLLDEEGVPAKVKETLQKINIAGTTLMELISDVLDISKVDAGKMELTPVQYDVVSFLNDIITLNVIRIEEKPVTFKLDISENLPRILHGDDLRVKQILNNLLSNAFKYTKTGTITLGVDCQRDGDTVWTSFCVSDTGIGIRKEDIGKLFTDYHQVDAKANRAIEGTGLGLSITKKFVELMGGEILVESEYGKGSTFRTRIPQGFVIDESIGKEMVNSLSSFRYSDDKKQAQKKLTRPDLSYARVLVVDDFPTNLDVAEGMLRKYKMQVDCAMSGQEAIDIIAAGKPVYNAVFMDHMMPGMDGVEATKAIRALGGEYAKNIPIIALTANAVAESEKMFLENGFNAFLPKPFNVMSLDSVVQEWIRKKSGE
jgi:PAS domain S-box-containing protein